LLYWILLGSSLCQIWFTVIYRVSTLVVLDFAWKQLYQALAYFGLQVSTLVVLDFAWKHNNEQFTNS